MKKHNIVKVVLITMLVFLLLTWILPAAYYSGQYTEQGRVQMGLFDLFNYPLTALSYFGYVSFFIILVGGFYGVLYKIPAYRTFLDKIVTKVQGKEKFVISTIIVLLALAVSICGLQIGLALFIPFIVSLILLMGYDKIVAALVTVGSMAVGLIGSTYAYANVGVLESSLGLKFDYEIGVRFIILLVGVILVIFNTLMYIKKNASNIKIEKKTIKKADEKVATKVEVENKATNSKKTTTKQKTSSNKNTTTKKSTTKTTKTTKSRKNDNKAALKDEDIIVVKESFESNELVPNTVDSKHKIWPIVTGFVVLFVLMILAFISWGEQGFNVSIFDDATKGILEFKLFGFELFGKLLGTVNSFGNWTLMEMVFPIVLVILLIALIYKVKLSDVFDGFAEGSKKALLPAFVALLVYTGLVIVTYHPFQLVIYKNILGWFKGFNIATTSIVAILASLFNADASYVFQSVVPYFTSVITNVDNYSIAGIIFQAMYGLTMLVAPTSLILVGILSYLKVSYKEWLKTIWKLLLELFIILLIIFMILTLI